MNENLEETIRSLASWFYQSGKFEQYWLNEGHSPWLPMPKPRKKKQVELVTFMRQPILWSRRAQAPSNRQRKPSKARNEQTNSKTRALCTV